MNDCECGCGTMVRRRFASGHNMVGKTGADHPSAKYKGLSMIPEYQAWAKMISRCTNPKHRQYRDYGGRGITVCERWQASYLDFLSDVGRKPSSEYTLDRINNQGNYEPSNVRWATYTEQAHNRRMPRSDTYPRRKATTT